MHHTTTEATTNMLRITTEKKKARTVLSVEGRLAGPFVPTLEQCWRELKAAAPQEKFYIDLCGVSFIDGPGKMLLREMHHQGVQLLAQGCLNQAIVKEIVGSDKPADKEKGNGKSGDTVSFERPMESRFIPASRRKHENCLVLALAVKEVEVADYHYQFYNALSALVADSWPEEVQARFHRTIREELSAEVHGEVDEKSWHLKQALLRRQTNVRKETKLFREYARQAFEDTLTLYLHGTCCDIDIETGPRQMPSRYLRRRLELLATLYPPPKGYAVLPEQAKKR